MSPPVPQPPPQTGPVNKGAPLAPAPGCFNPSSGPAMTGSQPAGQAAFPMNVFQQQLLAAQQQAMKQHQQQAAQQQHQQQQQNQPINSGIQPAGPNQFFVSTTTAQTTSAAPPNNTAASFVPQNSQLAAAMQQAAFAANVNASIPFLMNDPNVLMQAVQNAQMQQQQQQNAAARQQMPFPMTMMTPHGSVASTVPQMQHAAIMQQQFQAMNHPQVQMPNLSMPQKPTVHLSMAAQQPINMSSSHHQVPGLNVQQQTTHQVPMCMPQHQASSGQQMPILNMQQMPQMPTSMPQHQTSSGQQVSMLNTQQTPQVPTSMPQHQTSSGQQVSTLDEQKNPQAPTSMPDEVNAAKPQAPMSSIPQKDSQPQQAPPASTQQLAGTAPSATAPHVQACANVSATVIQQALKDPQFQAAGQVLLQAMNASSTCMNDLMKNQYAQQTQVTPTEQQQQVTPKTVGSDDFSAVPNQVFLESSLEPVKREEDSNDQAEDEMWLKYFFNKSSDEEGGSPHGSDDGGRASSVLSSEHLSRTSPTQTAPDIEPECATTSASPVASSTAPPVPPPTLSLQVPPSSPKSGATPKIVPVRAECGKVRKPTKAARQKPTITFEFQGSPHQYLMAILKERSYPSQRIPNAETSFQSKPTSLELASFGTEVVKAVNSGDVTKLKTLLDCGLSPSPCNSFGDFIFHLACRRANFAIVKCFVDYGCNIEVCDSFGRTPLHCVAWAGTFCSQSAELIMDLSPNQILVEDNRGQCPLEYVRKEQWPQWIDFLRRKMDTYWPIGGGPTVQARRESKSEERPEISLELATAVASGTMHPDRVAEMDDCTRKFYKQESLTSILFS